MNEEYKKYRIEQAHQYLERIRRMGEELAGLQALVDSQRELVDGLRGIDYSQGRVQSSATDDAIPNAIERLQAHAQRYVSDLVAYSDERFRANEYILRMDDITLATALRCRYILGWEWEKVCVQMNYTWQGMMSLRGRALNTFYDVMPHQERDPRYRAI